MPIHPTAIVEDGAQIGADVSIGPFCLVSSEAVLSDGVRLLSHVVVSGKTSIGARSVVHPHCALGGEAQIRGGVAPNARVTIGEDCVLREGVTVSCGSAKGGELTSIGHRTYLMANCHIGHDCHIGSDVTFSNGVLIAGHVEIADSVLIGGNSAVQQFSRIGRGAFLSGLSGVTLDIIPYGEAVGLHARHGGLNLIGLKRRGIPRARIHALRAAYRLIFLENDCSFAQSAKQALEKWPDMDEVREVAEFILAPAKRQIAPARRRGATDED
ncbi:MAG TPA: acyl-ACP--UDP-N-acetylglucosamine O-acyltransferase [Rhizomicrobium sp.]|jgi:UDP-N-acetylglucosamine acyltransferase|nr:acyl-ACP--UDP-N-acetylglucosamine O-acyltransferase [Rhizomicrobium sp.]